MTQEHKFSPHTESNQGHRDRDDSHFETNQAKGGPKVKVPSQERNVELCYVIRNRENVFVSEYLPFSKTNKKRKTIENMKS